MTPTQPSSPQTNPSQASGPETDLVALWSSARQLYPIYAELAREFVMDAPAPADLESLEETPAAETVEQAQRWLNEMDERIQVYQLRQFLQTSSPLDSEGLAALLRHFLAKTTRTDAVRDKIDFLLVQYFSQLAPTELDDNAVDLAYVAQELEHLLGAVELKAPVWFNALDRVLDSARRCSSLDQLLHGGVLEQGRKCKAQAGELFYLPIALVAFTRFGYLMRRVFFRLMLADLNSILDGLTELEEQGVESIDCRRAQFSEQEPVIRLRMICQSWKVLFQAEYSSGQPLRMLVDLRASVDAAVGRGLTEEGSAEAESKKRTISAAPARAATAAAGAGSSASVTVSRPEAVRQTSGGAAKPAAKFTASSADVPEFEISAGAPEWDPDAPEQPGVKKKNE